MIRVEVGGNFKEKVHRLVEVFYSQNFKTFYINSKDGKVLSSEPLGVFVSLGITTSLKVINNIINAINGSKDLRASLVEIGSRRDEGLFLNYITSENPTQYKVSEVPGLLTKEQVLEEIEKLKNSTEGLSLEEVQNVGSLVTRLESLFDKLEETDGWENHTIQKDDLGYRMYHLNVNYIKKDDIEYRIGILVNEKV